MNLTDMMNELYAITKEASDPAFKAKSNDESLQFIDRCEKLLDTELTDDNLAPDVVVRSRQCVAYVIRRVLESMIGEEHQDLPYYTKGIEEFLNNPQPTDKGFNLKF